MVETNSANNPLLVSRTAAGEAFRGALRLFIGRGKRHSVKQASNGSGVPDRTIECAMCDPESPDWRALSAEAILSLTSFLGPEFTSEWLHLANQAAFWLPDAGEKPPGELAADATEDAAAIARRAADGVIDSADIHELRPTGRRMMANGARLAFG